MTIAMKGNDINKILLIYKEIQRNKIIPIKIKFYDEEGELQYKQYISDDLQDIYPYKYLNDSDNIVQHAIKCGFDIIIYIQECIQELCDYRIIMNESTIRYDILYSLIHIVHDVIIHRLSIFLIVDTSLSYNTLFVDNNIDLNISYSVLLQLITLLTSYQQIIQQFKRLLLFNKKSNNTTINTTITNIHDILHHTIQQVCNRYLYGITRDRYTLSKHDNNNKLHDNNITAIGIIHDFDIQYHNMIDSYTIDTIIHDNYDNTIITNITRDIWNMINTEYYNNIAVTNNLFLSIHYIDAISTTILCKWIQYNKYILTTTTTTTTVLNDKYICVIINDMSYHIEQYMNIIDTLTIMKEYISSNMIQSIITNTTECCELYIDYLINHWIIPLSTYCDSMYTHQWILHFNDEDKSNNSTLSIWQSLLQYVTTRCYKYCNSNSNCYYLITNIYKTKLIDCCYNKLNIIYTKALLRIYYDNIDDNIKIIDDNDRMTILNNDINALIRRINNDINYLHNEIKQMKRQLIDNNTDNVEVLPIVVSLLDSVIIPLFNISMNVNDYIHFVKTCYELFLSHYHVDNRDSNVDDNYSSDNDNNNLIVFISSIRLIITRIMAIKYNPNSHNDIESFMNNEDIWKIVNHKQRESLKVVDTIHTNINIPIDIVHWCKAVCGSSSQSSVELLLTWLRPQDKIISEWLIRDVIDLLDGNGEDMDKKQEDDDKIVSISKETTDLSYEGYLEKLGSQPNLWQVSDRFLLP